MLTKSFKGQSLTHLWGKAKRARDAKFESGTTSLHNLLSPGLMSSNTEGFRLGLTEVTGSTEQLTHHMFTKQAQLQSKLVNSKVNSQVAFILSYFFFFWYSVLQNYSHCSHGFQCCVIPYNLTFIDLVTDDSFVTWDCPKVNVLVYLSVRRALICKVQLLKFKVNYTHHPILFQKRWGITANSPQLWSVSILLFHPTTLLGEEETLVYD